MTTESPTKGKDRSDNRDEAPGKGESPGRTGSPLACQQMTPIIETDAMPSSEAAVTQPYLPTIPRYEAKPRFSATYEGEVSISLRRLIADYRSFIIISITGWKLTALMQQQSADGTRKQAVEPFTSLI